MTIKPNIFLITIDCLRVDYLGYYQNFKNLTPSLDILAKKGVAFTQAISCGPYTRSSFLSIFTSTYPSMYPNSLYLSDFRPSFVEILKNNGYKTAGFNLNAYLSRFYNYQRGFDYFFDILSKKKTISIRKIVNLLVKLIKKTIFKRIFEIFPLKSNVTSDIRIINRKALSWLKKNKSSSFIWLHYMNMHFPYEPPRKFRKVSYKKMMHANKIVSKDFPVISKKTLNDIVSLYSNTLRYVDREIGLFFQKLKKQNLLENSMFIITADHGEQFKEHGQLSHPPKLYDELLRVPLIIFGPNVNKNTKTDKLVSLLDIAPTILDYLGVNINEDFKGKSFIPLLEGNSEVYNREGVISEIIELPTHKLTSYRTDKWKFIFSEEKEINELYNLEIDPYEQNNLYNQNSEIANEFRQKILDHLIMEREMHKKVKEMQKINKILKKIQI